MEAAHPQQAPPPRKLPRSHLDATSPSVLSLSSTTPEAAAVESILAGNGKMARRYDSRTTIFSPEGRLYQVEYAMEAINHAGTVIGILAQCAPPSEDDSKKDAKAKEGTSTKDDVTMTDAPAASTSASTTEPTASSSSASAEKAPGGVAVDPKTGKKKRMGVVLAAEKKVTSKLLEKEQGASEKIFVVNGNMISAVAGITADANSLVNYTRNVAQGHLMAYDEDMPVEQLVKRVCDMKQGYTQYGGLRPFGVSFLIAGYDPHHQFQLYSTDPSGNYSAWKATCVGNGNSTATSLLRQDYKDEIGVDEAVELACKVLGKTMDSTTLSSEKIEFAVMTLDEETGLPHSHVYKPEEIDALLKKQGLAKEESGDTTMATA